MEQMPSKQGQPHIGQCPSCDTRIRFRNNLFTGQMVTCPDCGDVLEVVRLNPIKLDWAFEEPFEVDDLEEDDEFDLDDDDAEDDYGELDDDRDSDDYDDDEYGT